MEDSTSRIPATLRAIPLAVAVMVCSSVKAEVPDVPVLTPESDLIDWAPGLASQGEFTEGQILDLAGDGVLDMLQQRGNRLAVVIGVDTYNASAEVPDLFGVPAQGVDTSAFDVIPAGFMNVPGDAFAVVGDLGLQVFWYANTASALSGMLIDGVAWAGATRVRSGDVDGDGYPDLVGIAANQIDVLIANGVAGGGYTSGVGYSLSAPVIDMLLLDFDAGTPGLEIAFNTPAGVEIRDHGNTELTSRSSLVSADSIARVQYTNDSEKADRLAWVTGLPNGLQALVVLHAGGAEPILMLDGIYVSAMSSGDANADGMSDLCLTSSVENEVWLLENQGYGGPAAPSFALTATALNRVALNPTLIPPSNNVSSAAFADIDFNGTVDLLVATQVETAIRVLYGDLVDGGPSVHSLPESQMTFHLAPIQFCNTGPDPTKWVLEVDVKYPLDLAAGESLEVVTWYQPDVTTETHPDAVSRCDVSFAGPGSTLRIVIPETIEGDTPDFESVYFVTVRSVVNVGGVIKQVAPMMVGAYAVDMDDFLVLPTQPGWTGGESASQCFEPIGDSGDGPLEGPGASPVGGFAYVRKPFRFPVGLLPQTGGASCPPSQPDPPGDE